MAADPAPADLLESYTRIGEGLKKRFLKNPNVLKTEAAYRELLVRAQQDGCRFYSAFIAEAIARCEGALGAGFSEAGTNAETAHMLMNLELEERSMGYEGYDAAATEATQLYNFAVSAYMGAKKYALAASLYLEVARAHLALEAPRKALLCLRAATACMLKTPTTSGCAPSTNLLATLEAQVPVLISLDEYEAANEALEQIVAACEAMRRAPNIEGLDRWDAAHASALLWQGLMHVRLGAFGALLGVCESLLILTDSSALDAALPDLLESLADAKRRGDGGHVRAIQTELAPRCSAAQRELLERVTEPLSSPDVGVALIVDLLEGDSDSRR